MKKLLIAAPLVVVIAAVAWYLPRVPDSVPVALFFVFGAAVLVHKARGARRANRGH